MFSGKSFYLSIIICKSKILDILISKECVLCTLTSAIHFLNYYCVIDCWDASGWSFKGYLYIQRTDKRTIIVVNYLVTQYLL